MAGWINTSEGGLRRKFIIWPILAGIVTLLFLYHQKYNITNKEVIECKSSSALDLKLKDWFTNAETSWANKTEQRNQELRNYPSLLTGGKVNAVDFFHLFKSTYSCPFEVSRVGNKGDGGKWTCGLDQLSKVYRERPCVFYSFGVAGDSSFEAGVLEKVNCQVFAYDPTVSKIGKPLNSSDPRVKFERIGLSSVDNIHNLYRYRTLKELMKQNGHTWIDILKMDVEGGEFAILRNICQDFPKVFPVGQLLFEVHIIENNYRPKLLEVFDQLEKREMRPFSYEPNPSYSRGCEYSFFNIKAVLNKFEINLL